MISRRAAHTDIIILSYDYACNYPVCVCAWKFVCGYNIIIIVSFFGFRDIFDHATRDFVWNEGRVRLIPRDVYSRVPAAADDGPLDGRPTMAAAV